MLPIDRNPEKEMRQRFLQREADLREAKAMRPDILPLWTVEVRFEREDFEDENGRPMGMNSLANRFMRIARDSHLEIEERFREQRLFVKIPAQNGPAAMKVANDFLDKARKNLPRF